MVVAELGHRPRRAAALIAGLLVASSGFVLLTASVDSSRARVHGAVRANFRPAYDLLVRPSSAASTLERERGLISASYGSGIFGGITFKQLSRIQHTAGVDVAAPVANIGYVFPTLFLHFPVNKYVTGAPTQLFRIRTSEVSQRGSSSYRLDDEYVYYTRRSRFRAVNQYLWVKEETPHGLVDVCGGPAKASVRAGPPTSPFDVSVPGISCYSARTPKLRVTQGEPPVGDLAGTIRLEIPLLLSAIDPVQEARLVGLDKTMVEGRYLRPGEGLHQAGRGGFQGHSRTIPLIADSTTYLDQTLEISIQRLNLGGSRQVAQRLASASMPAYVSGLTGSVVDRVIRPAAADYPAVLRRYEHNSQFPSFADFSEYRRAGSVRYVERGGSLVPETVRNPVSVWESDFIEGFAPVPPANADVAFRRLNGVRGTNRTDPANTNLMLAPGPQIVGEFDPATLTGFSALSRVPLETYFPPQVTGTDAESRATLHDQPLLPDANLAGYLAQPPALLTTLDAARESFWDPNLYFDSSLHFEAPKAPISYIRVRVAGVTGPDKASLARLDAVAAAIHDKTGLTVDVTDGSSPAPQTINLPAGRFGRPALTVSEGWVDKGVAITFLRAVDRKSLMLFVLLLVVCIFFLANAATAAERARRTDLGVLACLGWSRRQLFALVLGQQALVGAVAGLAGTAVAAGLAPVFGLHVGWWRLAVITPVAVVLACAAGLLAARRAARSRPIDAVAAPVMIGRRARPVRSVFTLAAANLRRVPGRTLVGAAGLFVSITALTILAGLTWAFRGVLVGSLLGNAISLQLRAADYLAVALMLVLAAFSIADVVYLNVSERAEEIATLAALGWRAGTIRRLFATEGLLIALTASLAGAALGAVFVLSSFTASAWATIGVAAGAAACGLLVTGAAITVPLAVLGRRSPAAALSAAE